MSHVLIGSARRAVQNMCTYIYTKHYCDDFYCFRFWVLAV